MTQPSPTVTPEPAGAYTLFADVRAQRQKFMPAGSWRQLAESVRAPSVVWLHKDYCPLVSMCEYGDTTTAKGSLRHQANVLRVFGIEGDYDDEEVSLPDAAARIRAAGIAALLYTSPSHRPDKPRWRVLCPLSVAAPPERRKDLVGRLNQVVGGILADESFTLSQSFYIGQVAGTAYQAIEVEGRCIDLASNVDPLYPRLVEPTATGFHDATTDEELRAAFTRGEGRHEAMVKLSSRWAARGMPAEDIGAALHGLLDQSPLANPNTPAHRRKVEEIARSAAAKFQETRRGTRDAPEPPLRAAPFPVISARDFIALPLLERAPIIESVLYERSLGEIHAWRGVGKTWIAMMMARSIALAERFLHWDVPQKRRVLFVDGEMSGRELQDRFRALGTVPERMDLMASELLWGAEGQGLIINDPGHQARLRATLQSLEAAGRRPDVIFFDNLSSLTSGIDENSNSELDELLAFLRQMRHEGYTVIFVHHDGKGGDQRGASRREDFLDLVIHLHVPKEKRRKNTGSDEDEDDEPAPGEPKFTFEFTKTRGKRPTPYGFKVSLIADQVGNLTAAMERAGGDREAVIEQKEHMLRYVARTEGPVTRQDIKQAFNVAQSTANEHVQKLIKLRWLSGEAGPLKVTQFGRRRLDQLWPEEASL